MKMDNSKKYAFFIDIDGTLYVKGKIPQKNRSAIKAVRQAGHLVFINTARSMGNMPEKVKKLKVDGFICSLGCNIVVGGKSVRSITIAPQELSRVFDILNKNGDTFVFEGEKTLICNERFFKKNSADYMNCAVDGEDYLSKYYDQPVAKVFLSGQMSARSNAELKNDYDIIQHKNYAEFGVKGCDKAAGIKYICLHYNIKRENCVAIGDSMNDLEMFKYCAVSVAVGNASDEIKKICDVVTDDAINGGVGKAMLEIAGL